MNKHVVSMTLSQELLEILDECKGRMSRSAFAEELMIIGVEALENGTI